MRVIIIASALALTGCMTSPGTVIRNDGPTACRLATSAHNAAMKIIRFVPPEYAAAVRATWAVAQPLCDNIEVAAITADALAAIEAARKAADAARAKAAAR